MKYLDGFRNPEPIHKLRDEIRRLTVPDRHYRIMEVCGGHTHSIYRFGIQGLYPITSN